MAPINIDVIQKSISEEKNGRGDHWGRTMDLSFAYQSLALNLPCQCSYRQVRVKFKDFSRTSKNTFLLFSRTEKY